MNRANLFRATTDNSPPFQRRESRQNGFKPRGDVRDLRKIQPSLRDLCSMGHVPAINRRATLGCSCRDADGARLCRRPAAFRNERSDLPRRRARNDAPYLPKLVRKFFSSRAKAASKAAWFFQLEKSGR